VLIERANDIDFIHIVVKYNNHNDVITYGNFMVLYVLQVSSFKSLSPYTKVIELLGLSYQIGSYTKVNCCNCRLVYACNL